MPASMQLAPLIGFINELPNEVLVRIFTFCVETITLSPDIRRVIPLGPLSEVCARWRAVVRWRPELWTSVSVDFKDFTETNCLVTAARRCLSRSGDRLPITLSLYTTSTKFDWAKVVANGGHKAHPIRSLVLPFAARLRDVRLSLPYVWLVEFFKIPPGRLRGLESALIEQIVQSNSERIIAPVAQDTLDVLTDAPHLKHLTLRCYPRPHRRSTAGLSFVFALSAEPDIPWAQLTHLDLIGLQIPYAVLHKTLQRCSNLISCAISTGTPSHDAVGVTLLPHLKTLTLDVHTCGWLYLNPCKFPALERLTLQGDLHSRFSSDFVAALIWGLPVKSISTSIPMPETSVERLFRAAPDLVEFEACETCYIPDTALEDMTRGDLVPCLERVHCSLRTVLLNKFIDMLEYRWAQQEIRPSYHAIDTARISCFVSETDLWDFEDDEMDTMFRHARARLRSIGQKAEGIQLVSVY